MVFSKMTFAHLSQATNASQRFYHRTKNTFNRIQISLMTIEIHHQGAKKSYLIITQHYLILFKHYLIIISAKTSF